MANDDLSAVTARLDRIEQFVARLGILDDLVSLVDPSPEDIARIRPDIFQLRLIDVIRRLIPKGDPPPDNIVRWRGNMLNARIGDILQRNPGWFTDPPPEDFLNVRVLDLIRRWRGGFTDPAPDDLANVRLRDLIQRIPGGGFTDPSPEDIGRLTSDELEGQLHKLHTEMVRMRSLERLLSDRLEQIKGKTEQG